QRLLLFREALIFLSYSGKKKFQAPNYKLQRSSNIQASKLACVRDYRSPLLGPFLELGAWDLELPKVVVPRGNAPRSSGYRPGALLLSYRTLTNLGLMPKRFSGRNTIFSFTGGRMRMTRLRL